MPLLARIPHCVLAVPCLAAALLFLPTAGHLAQSRCGQLALPLQPEAPHPAVPHFAKSWFIVHFAWVDLEYRAGPLAGTCTATMLKEAHHLEPHDQVGSGILGCA